MRCRAWVIGSLGAYLLYGMAAPATLRAMDRVRIETRADDAVAAYGVSGAGVSVAILDRGIDWTHPDFRKPDGTTRIKWLLDMSGQYGCDPTNPPPIEYSEAQINAALSGGPAVSSDDYVGHGTVTTGIAAGDGSAFANGKYRGMAPNADLIIVKMVSDGATNEAPFYACLDDALDWLDAKIDLLGQPCVALINSGVQWGPMDGTSAVSQKIDEVFGLDRPGRVYVSPSGDEGGYPTHAGGTYTQSDESVVSFSKQSTQTVYLSMWYSGAQPAEITVAFDDGTTVGPVAPDGFLLQDGIYIIQYPPGGAFYPWTSSGPDRAVSVQIVGHEGLGSVRIRGTTPGNGMFDLYSAEFLTMAFLDQLVPGRIMDYSTSLSATVVGAHVNKTTYVDINGQPQFVGNQGAVDELWTHSSDGPTRDGRQGLDLSAPGHICFAAYAQNSDWVTYTWNVIQDGGGWYGGAGATSGSAPIVVGAVALLLEDCPTLTGAEARQLLRNSAGTDKFTGVTPNTSWGYGKLDVLGALAALHAGDFAGFDGDVDLHDVAHFQNCYTGAGAMLAACSCQPADLDHDADADLADCAALVSLLTGP